MSMRRLAAAAAATAVAVTLSGCSDEPASGLDRHDFGVPGFVQTITTDVSFYPACGNETLTMGGTTWYQYDPSNINDFPNPKRTLEAWQSGRVGTLDDGGDGRVQDDAAQDDVAGALGMPGADGRGAPAAAAPIGAVAAPGIGDDTGTLIVYTGGIAYWQADSDHLATWLTTHHIVYNWVC